MEFFKTDKGLIHVGRVAFIGYGICVAFCIVGDASGDVGGTLITFAMGWWIAFCGKRPPADWDEYTTGLRLRFGIGLSSTAATTQVFRLLFLNRHH